MFAPMERVAVATAAVFFFAGGIAAAQNEATVSVVNQNAHDVEIAAEQEDGTQIQLGLVRGLSDRTFTLPASIQGGAGEFRIRMTCMLPPPPGSSMEQYHEAVKTGLLKSMPGYDIVVTVADPLAESTVGEPRKRSN